MGEFADRIIAAFKEETEPYRASWRSVQVKVVGATQGDTWTLLGLQANLSYEEGFGLDITFDDPKLIMLTYSFETKALESFLDALGSGCITVAGRELQVIGFGQGKCDKYRKNQHGLLSQEFPYVLLSFYGKSVRELVEENDLDDTLRRWGHDSLYEASGEFLGFPVGGANSTCILLLAPIYILGSARFVGQELQVSVTHHEAINRADIGVSFEAIAERSAPPLRGKLPLSPSALEHLSDFQNDTASIRVPEETRSATVRVFHKEKPDPVDICVVSRPVAAELNPAWTALRLLWSRTDKGQPVDGRDVFQERLCLTGQGKDAGRFEAAILNLMACAGYSSVFTGREGGATGIDLLAFAPDAKEAVAISATLTNNIREKLRTLLPQAERLGGDLKSITVIPAIFAPVEPSVVLKSDKEDAKAHDVALVLLPELRLLSNSVSTMSLGDLRQSLRSILLQGKRVPGMGL